MSGLDPAAILAGKRVLITGATGLGRIMVLAAARGELDPLPGLPDGSGA